MTDKNRLIELVDKAKEEYANDITDHTETDYIVETLLNEGAILPPCKVGDKVYYPSGSFDRIFEKTVDEILINENESDIGCYVHFASTYMPFENIGKTVFLTKEEAERALAERSKDNA